MKGVKPIYGALAMVFVASFGFVWILPADAIFRSFAAFPGSLALLGTLFQLWRDERDQERKIELQNRQQDFALGTASHMATVAYDKHVAFCEEYLTEVFEVFQHLAREGATKEAVDLGARLVRIRLKHSAWLTSDIETSLEPFENALITMGAKGYSLEGEPDGEHRAKIVDEIYEYFRLLMGVGDPNEESVRIAREDVINEIRKIVGIDELTTLRRETVGFAIKRLQQH